MTSIVTTHTLAMLEHQGKKLAIIRGDILRIGSLVLEIQERVTILYDGKDKYGYKCSVKYNFGGADNLTCYGVVAKKIRPNNQTDELVTIPERLIAAAIQNR